MQRIRSVILRQRVCLPVERERSIGDAVGITSDNGAKIGRIRHITFGLVVAENDIRKLPLAVGNTKRQDDATVIHGADFNTVSIGQRVQNDGPPVPRAQVLLLDSGFLFRGSLSEEQSADGGDENKSACKDQPSWDHGEECTTGGVFCDVRPHAASTAERRSSRVHTGRRRTSGSPADRSTPPSGTMP